MRYLITFLEGIVTFISPCVLPMIPIYVVYFTGEGDGKKSRALRNSLGFVLGFTVIFVLLGVFAGTAGGFLAEYKTAVNIVTGALVVLFGLSYTGVFKLGFLSSASRPQSKLRPDNFFAAVLFGIIFAVGWSPCTGAFLGSAMMLAANEESWLQGMLLLLSYSLGLGVPFVLCAVLIEKLKGAFDFIKRNYRTINLVCGIFLIIIGVMMMFGLMTKITALFS